MTWKEFEALNIPKTEFITAIFFGGDDDKSKFAARFGDEAKNALAIFTTKKIYEQTGVTTENGQKVIFTKDESGKITTYTKDEAIVRFGFRPSDINHWFSQGEGAKSDTSDKEKFDKIFTKVETPPTYNGPGTLIDFVKKNMRYPADASYKKIDGRVVIKFVVNEEGELKNFTALSSVGGGLEEEAIRLIKASGIWKPAVQNGRKVPFEMIQEIDFKHPQKSTNGFIESLPKSNLLMKMNKGDGC
jgi:TonB family protein